MAEPLMIPVDRLRPCAVPDVKGPAIVFPIDSYDLSFLVVGEGDKAVACILGDQYPFEGMPLSEAGRFKGLAIEQVEFEVDLGSMYPMEGYYPLVGSLLRSETGLELVYKHSDARSYPGVSRVALFGDPKREGPTAGFRTWRANIRVGDEKIEVWRYSAPERPPR